MHAPPQIGDTLRRLSPQLESIPGVHRVVTAGPPWEVFVICQHPVANAAEVEVAVRSRLAEHGFTAADVAVQISFVAAPAPRHRVRFAGSSARSLGPARAAATVTLEWGGRTFEETEEGEGGVVAALRLPALATLRALQAVAGRELRLRLVGIKTMRVFDSDLVVVLLRSGPSPGQQLIGASLVSNELHRSAALAVLHATNRILGNYLALGEGDG